MNLSGFPPAPIKREGAYYNACMEEISEAEYLAEKKIEAESFEPPDSDKWVSKDDGVFSSDANTYPGYNPICAISCRKCGSDRLYVGVAQYYTAIKCPDCGWQTCIHEG